MNCERAWRRRDAEAPVLIARHSATVVSRRQPGPVATLIARGKRSVLGVMVGSYLRYFRDADPNVDVRHRASRAQERPVTAEDEAGERVVGIALELHEPAVVSRSIVVHHARARFDDSGNPLREF